MKNVATQGADTRCSEDTTVVFVRRVTNGVRRIEIR